METHSKHFFADYNVEPIDKKCKPILVADSFSTPSNVGSLIRLASNLGALRVVVLNGDHLRESKIKKTAASAYTQVDVVFADSENWRSYVPNDYSLVALETAGEPTSVFSELPLKMALVLGNEKHGVSQDVLHQCDSIRFIPMPGTIKSMNVSHAAAVSLFEWYRQNMG